MGLKPPFDDDVNDDGDNDHDYRWDEMLFTVGGSSIFRKKTTMSKEERGKKKNNNTGELLTHVTHV